jgi:hypothetical protein
VVEEQGGNVYTVEYTGEYLDPYAVGDLDADGRSEIIGQYGGEVRVYESPDPWSHPSQLVWRSPWISNIEMFATTADTDRDGKWEIIRSVCSGGILIYENTGDDMFSEVFFGPTGQCDGNKVIADLDGDGLLEIAFCGLDGDFFVFESPADNVWVETFRDSSGMVNAYGGAGGVDTDGNGVPEVFIGGAVFPVGSTTAVYEAVGNDDFEKVATWTLGAPANGSNSAVGDLNGDGSYKYVTDAAGLVYVYAGNSGQWTLEELHDTGSGYPYRCAPYDLNQNGRDELFLVSHEIDPPVLERPASTSDAFRPPNERVQLRASPNPLNSETLIQAVGGTLEPGTLRIYDVAGALVHELRLRGMVPVRWRPPASLPNGTYFLSYEDLSGSRSCTKAVVVR